MKDKLLIIGAGGHGKVVADIAIKINNWKDILFFDDDVRIKSVLGFEVVGGIADAYNYFEECDIFVAIGNNDARERICKKIEAIGVSIPTLIHPNAIIGEHVKIGKGTAVMAGAVINCCSNIGKGCIINTGATIDHDNIIEDYVHISPGAHTAGTVNVGKGTWLGIGSVISNNINIAGGCIVGAGAVVVKDLDEPGVYVGVPARRIR